MYPEPIRFTQGKLREWAQHDSLGVCHPERSEGSLAEFTLSEANGLGMTAWEFVILSAAKDLSRAFVQQTQLAYPWDLWGITSVIAFEIADLACLQP